MSTSVAPFIRGVQLASPAAALIPAGSILWADLSQNPSELRYFKPPTAGHIVGWTNVPGVYAITVEDIPQSETNALVYTMGFHDGDEVLGASFATAPTQDQAELITAILNAQGIYLL